MGLFDKLLTKKNGKTEAIVLSPLKGRLLPLQDVKDEAFSCGALGNGVAVEPYEGKVVSPVDGTVVSLFPTKHAIGLLSEDGAEVLIHIGLDTVQLNGRYFEAHIKQGAKVRAGDLLVTFDLDKLKEEGYETQVPVLITNTPAFSEFVMTSQGEVDYQDLLMKLKK